MALMTSWRRKGHICENRITVIIATFIVVYSFNSSFFNLQYTACATLEDPSILAAQQNLLSLFGMKKRPVNADRKRAIIPKAMLELYHRQTTSDVESPMLPLPGSHTKSANTIRSYTHLETEVDYRFLHSHTFRLRFNTTNIPVSEKLTGAELKISTVPKEKIHNAHLRSPQRVLVHDIVLPGKKGISKPILRLVDSKEIQVGQKEITLDVLPAVERWLETTDGNYGLLIKVVHENGSKPEVSHVRLRRSVAEDEDEVWEEVQPLLFIYTDDERHKKHSEWGGMPPRRKRTSSPQDADKKKPKRKGKDICQRHPLYVDFEKVGWNDWIVAPPGYEAYYCAGDCPFPLADHLNSTNHAIVQTLMHSMHPLQIPKTCCVPTSLAPISMLYLDEENKVVLKNYQDMSVIGCGCR